METKYVIVNLLTNQYFVNDYTGTLEFSNDIYNAKKFDTKQWAIVRLNELSKNTNKREFYEIKKIYEG